MEHYWEFFDWHLLIPVFVIIVPMTFVYILHRRITYVCATTARVNKDTICIRNSNAALEFAFPAVLGVSIFLAMISPCVLDLTGHIDFGVLVFVLALPALLVFLPFGILCTIGFLHSPLWVSIGDKVRIVYFLTSDLLERERIISLVFEELEAGKTQPSVAPADSAYGRIGIRHKTGDESEEVLELSITSEEASWLRAYAARHRIRVDDMAGGGCIQDRASQSKRAPYRAVPERESLALEDALKRSRRGRFPKWVRGMGAYCSLGSELSRTDFVTVIALWGTSIDDWEHDYGTADDHFIYWLEKYADREEGTLVLDLCTFSDSAEMREGALEYLVELHPGVAMRRGLELLNDPTEDVVFAAIEAIESIDPSTAKRLTRSLAESPHEGVQRCGARLESTPVEEISAPISIAPDAPRVVSPELAELMDAIRETHTAALPERLAALDTICQAEPNLAKPGLAVFTNVPESQVRAAALHKMQQLDPAFARKLAESMADPEIEPDPAVQEVIQGILNASLPDGSLGGVTDGISDQGSSPADHAIGEYMCRIDEGEAVDREEFIAQHAGAEEELREYFTDLDDVEALVAVEPRSSNEEHEADLNLPVSGNIRYFGDYELLDEIGRGGMGVVYRARQRSLNRIVAVKLILSGRLASEQDLQRFQFEAEAAANLDHPGIVPIYEIGEHQGQHYFSMGFVDGMNLAEKAEESPLEPRIAAEYVKKIAEAIAFAHDKGVIHRDLKPSNVLIDSTGEPRITDFGLARRTDTDSSITSTGQILGTPSYMPPEQVLAATKEVTPKADVYSLGAILYCLLSGRAPYQSASVPDTLLLVLASDPVPLRRLDPGIPEDLETICLKCLEKKPDQRYSTARDLAGDLQRYLENRPIEARPVSQTERLFRWCQRNLAISLLAGIVACVLVSVAIAGLVVAHQQYSLREQLQEQGEAVERERNEALQALAELEFEQAYNDFQLGEEVRGVLRLGFCLQRAVGLKNKHLEQSIRFQLGARHPDYQPLLFSTKVPGPIVAAGFNGAGTHASVATRDSVWLLGVNSRSFRQVVQESGRSITAVTCSNDGQDVVVATENGQVQIYEATTGELRGKRFRHPNPVVAITYAEPSLFTLTDDWALRQWDIRDGSIQLGPWQAEVREVFPILGPDNLFVKNRGLAWNLRLVNHDVLELYRTDAFISPSDLSGDIDLTGGSIDDGGACLITRSADGAVQLWQLDKPLPTLQEIERGSKIVNGIKHVEFHETDLHPISVQTLCPPLFHPEISKLLRRVPASGLALRSRDNSCSATITFPLERQLEFPVSGAGGGSPSDN